MPTWLNLLLAGVAGVAAIALLVGVTMSATGLSRDPNSTSPARPTPGGDAIFTSSTGEAASDIWPHHAPDTPLTADEAHRDMQTHRGCRLDECARKAAAFQTLIEAGRVTPDSGRMPY